MFATALIIFRETLEASLFVGIIAAATRGLHGRAGWLLAGVGTGLGGALLLAAGASAIGTWFDGIGQDLVNAAILGVALAMLVWHCVWMSNHGAAAAAGARQMGSAVLQGEGSPWALALVVALSVLREGAETVLFVAGYAGTAGNHGILGGALLGLSCGIGLGTVVYLGLARIPLHRMFAVTNTLILLLAAASASQLAQSLSQAGLLDFWGQALWDTSALLSTESPLGALAHAMVGYSAQPTGLQLTFYVLTVGVIITGSRWVRWHQAHRAVVGARPGALQHR